MTVTEAGPDGRPDVGPERSRRDVTVLVVAALLVAWAVVRGQQLQAAGATLVLRGAQPLTGPLRDSAPSLRYLVPVLLGVLAVAVVPRAASAWPYRRVLLASGPAAALWALALALTDGYEGIFGRLSSRFEYLTDVDRVGSPVPFLRGFVDQVVTTGDGTEWVTHVAGHPPGALLMFWWLQAVGLGGEVWAALAMVAAGASAVPAALVVLRVLAGEPAARRVAPFLVLAPFAIWVATSADAAFLGVSAWGVALLALGSEGAPSWRRDALALAGGVLLGSALFLSYGVLPLGAVPLVVALVAAAGRGRAGGVRVLAVAAVGVAAVVLAYLAAGFWWGDGFAATRVRWAQGVGPARPLTYFVGANLAALALAVGPAVVVGLGRLRTLPWAVGAVVGAALLSVTASNLSGLSRGEVERIWLPFMPWLALAALALPAASTRRWLGAQVAVTLVVQLVLVGKW